LAWLRQRGTRLAQALLGPDEVCLAAPLERNGFAHVTSLHYLRHSLDTAAEIPPGSRLTYQTYSQDPALFQTILLRTYEGTLDCPELNGVRDVAEIVDGHQAQGIWDPGRWWLAREAGRPVAVLLLMEVPDWQGWDISYLGVIPEARGRGVGRQLAARAVQVAKQAGAAQLTLAVDARNNPAKHLYRRAGFREAERREVFLTFLSPAATSPVS
jgi:ribosomal protein S18 acetylase RimI-like enzyme